MADKTHLYNLKAVINEVGIRPATLRAWERRYGLLKPQRSPGGHRLYSRQEIEMLKWLVGKQKEGLSISSAIEMWKNQQGNFQKVLQQFQVPVIETGAGATLIDGLRAQWISACLVFDDQAANYVLDQAFAIAPPETVCTDVVQRGMRQIGEAWYAGSASVQHEHFASVFATRRVNALMTAVNPPSRTGRILIACPPGEEHGFILLLVSYLLKRRGWDVVYLGADAPLKDLDGTIHTISPALIISAAQTLPAAVSLRAMSESVTQSGVPLAYGGGIFTHIPAATRSISGYFLGDEVTQVPQIAEPLIAEPPAMPVAQAVTAEYSRVLASFIQKEELMLDFVVSALQARQFNPEYLEIAHLYLPQLIISALGLGEVNFLEYPITWLNGFLNNFGMSTSEAMEIYSAYSLAIDRYLGGDGAIIHDWLATHILSG